MKRAECSRFRHDDLNMFLPDLVLWGWNPGQEHEASPIPRKSVSITCTSVW